MAGVFAGSWFMRLWNLLARDGRLPGAIEGPDPCREDGDRESNQADQDPCRPGPGWFERVHTDRDGRVRWRRRGGKLSIASAAEGGPESCRLPDPFASRFEEIG